MRLDAAQDQGPNSPPPNGGPRGSYRSFTATSGSIDVTIAVRPPGGGCALDGTGHFDLIPGFMNQVIVQLDVPNPAYVVAFTGTFAETVEVTRSGGAGCSGTSPWPVFAPWACHRDVRAHRVLVCTRRLPVGADARGVLRLRLHHPLEPVTRLAPGPEVLDPRARRGRRRRA